MSSAVSVDLELDNELRLETLAAEANEAHKLAESSAKTALEHARDAGLKLNEAKSRSKHGEWLKWLEEHFEGTRLNAWRYMRIADKWDEISNVSQPEHLGVRKALELLSESRDTEDPEVEPVEVKPSHSVLVRQIKAFGDKRLTTAFEAHEVNKECALLLGELYKRGLEQTLEAVWEHAPESAKVRTAESQLRHLVSQHDNGQTDEQIAQLVEMVENGEAESVFDAHRIRQAERQAEKESGVRAVAQKAAQDLAGHDKQLDPKAVGEVERIALELASGEGWEELSEEEQIGFIQGAAGEDQAASYQKSSKPKPEKDPESMVTVQRGLLLSLKQLARYAPISQRQAHMTTWNDKL